MPFVQGKLRNEYVVVEVETRCSHCDQLMHLTIDSNLKISMREQGASPWVFMPDVDWEHFAEKTIIDAY